MQIDNKFVTFAKAWLGDNWDTVDIDSEWDSSLSLKENIVAFKQKHFRVGEYTQSIEKMLESQQNEIIEEKISLLKQKHDEELSKELRTKPILSFYKPVYEAIGRLSLKSNQINLIMIKGRGGIGKCLSETTMIDTPKGNIMLKNLKEGDYVYGYDFKDNKVKPTQIIQKQESIKNEVVLIESEGRKIESSLEHRFYTSNGWVQAKDLNIGDIIYMYGRTTSHIRGVGIHSRDSRWRRQFNDNPMQTKEKISRELHNIKTTTDNIKLGYKPNDMVKGKVEIGGIQAIATQQGTQGASQEYLSVLDKEPLQTESDIRGSSALSENKTATSRTHAEFRGEKITDKPKEVTRQTIHNKRLSDLLVYSEFELNPIRIQKCSRISKKKTTLQDIATTLTNFFAEGILVHNSWNIRDALIRNKLEYKEIQVVTEASLPEILYKNTDKVIWFKDVIKLFNNPNCIDIIKAATETDVIDGGRLISINKYSHELKKAGVPKEFVFKGSIVFDYNDLKNARYLVDFNAMKSRGYMITLVFDKKEIAEIMRKIAVDEVSKKVTSFLIRHFKDNESFNLRTQAKAINTARCSIESGLDWQKVLFKELSMSRTEVQEFLYEFLGDGMKPKADLIRWIRQGRIYAQSDRTARRRVDEWLSDGEIYQTPNEYNPLVSLKQIEVKA